MLKRKERDLKGHKDDTYILRHEAVPYSIKDNSRYKHIDELSLYDGKLIKATPGPIDLSVFPIDGLTPYSVPKHMEDRIDLIALKFYGLSSLYWVICYQNGIVDPLSVPAGSILYIPTLSSLRKFPNPLA